jgi:hypothetical protein
VADILISFLQDHLYEVICSARHQLVHDFLGDEGLALPMVEGNFESKTVCFMEETLERAVVKSKVAPLRPHSLLLLRLKHMKDRYGQVRCDVGTFRRGVS